MNSSCSWTARIRNLISRHSKAVSIPDYTGFSQKEKEIEIPISLTPFSLRKKRKNSRAPNLISRYLDKTRHTQSPTVKLLLILKVDTKRSLRVIWPLILVEYIRSSCCYSSRTDTTLAHTYTQFRIIDCFGGRESLIIMTNWEYERRSFERIHRHGKAYTYINRHSQTPIRHICET